MQSTVYKSIMKVKNSLKNKRPDLAAEWHPTRNGRLTPETVSPQSNKKAWWICKKGNCEHKHEWEAIIGSRFRGNGCPYCDKKRICPCDSLQNKRPDIAAEWHPTRNGNFSPEMVTSFSSKKAWWICKKNNCEHEHEWEATVSNRSTNHGCPFCAKKKFCPCNSLKALRPDLAAEWHPVKNGSLRPEMFAPQSGRKVWWICKKSQCEHKHEWQSTIGNRFAEHGCPFCAKYNGKFCPCFSLKVLRPDIAGEWHPIKNGDLTPELFSANSQIKVWWQCKDCLHEWQASIGNRTQKSGTGCPNHNSSKGEKLVKEILDRRQVSYVAQYSIRPQGLGRFLLDFYLPHHKVAIEFDGIQHFEPVGFFDKKKDLAERQMSDSIKNYYCLGEGITVFRLHYKDLYDIEGLLDFVLGRATFTYILYSASYD